MLKLLQYARRQDITWQKHFHFRLEMCTDAVGGRRDQHDYME